MDIRSEIDTREREGNSGELSSTFEGQYTWGGTEKLAGILNCKLKNIFSLGSSSQIFLFGDD